MGTNPNVGLVKFIFILLLLSKLPINFSSLVKPSDQVIEGTVKDQFARPPLTWGCVRLVVGASGRNRRFELAERLIEQSELYHLLLGSNILLVHDSVDRGELAGCRGRMRPALDARAVRTMARLFEDMNESVHVHEGRRLRAGRRERRPDDVNVRVLLGLELALGAAQQLRAEQVSHLAHLSALCRHGRRLPAVRTRAVSAMARAAELKRSFPIPHNDVLGAGTNQLALQTLLGIRHDVSLNPSSSAQNAHTLPRDPNQTHLLLHL
jgi:hypothetical protein